MLAAQFVAGFRQGEPLTFPHVLFLPVIECLMEIHRVHDDVLMHAVFFVLEFANLFGDGAGYTSFLEAFLSRVFTGIQVFFLAAFGKAPPRTFFQFLDQQNLADTVFVAIRNAAGLLTNLFLFLLFRFSDSELEFNLHFHTAPC